MTRSAWLSLLLFVSLTRCVSREDANAHLIVLETVDQSWEQPDRLTVHGAGLPQAARGRARLTGTLFPPSEAPQAIDVVAPCRTEGTSEAVVDLHRVRFSDERAGPFEGTLELSFGERAQTHLVGRLEGLSVRLGGAESLMRRLHMRTRAQAFQRELGFAEIQLGEPGVSLERLSPGGLAERAGLAPHDVVLRLNGRPVQLPHDLVSSTIQGPLELEVVRPSEGFAHRLVHIAAAETAFPHVGSLLALCCALGAVLAAVLCRVMPLQSFWSPRRREYWLSVASGVSLLLVSALVLREVHWLVRLCAYAFAAGATAAGLVVYLLRRLRRTSRTLRDPNLAPLL